MKYLKYILLTLLAIIILGFLYVKFAVSESRPTIVEGKAAAPMAQKMLNAVNQAAWDTLPYIQWTFRGTNHYVWDKKNNDALIKWGDIEVHLDPDEVAGKTYKAGQLLEGAEHDKTLAKAWSNWCNDMYWLAAPFKIQDPGTELAVATDSDGKEGLLVTYASGGVTPGDSYLWFLGDDGLPTSYKMWVKIIPIGGMEFSWEDWTTLPGGSQVAGLHKGVFAIPVENIKGGNSWADLGYDASPIQL